MKIPYLQILTALFLLASCGNEELYPVTAGGGAIVSRAVPNTPSKPIAPPAFQSENHNIPGQVEIHNAATEEGCRDMARRFKREGRRLTLRKIEFVGGQLPFKCEFVGEDATDNYYGDDRYETDR